VVLGIRKRGEHWSPRGCVATEMLDFNSSNSDLAGMVDWGLRLVETKAVIVFVFERR
jgi:hypothetical protein